MMIWCWRWLALYRHSPLPGSASAAPCPGSHTLACWRPHHFGPPPPHRRLPHGRHQRWHHQRGPSAAHVGTWGRGPHDHQPLWAPLPLRPVCHAHPGVLPPSPHGPYWRCGYVFEMKNGGTVQRSPSQQAAGWCWSSSGLGCRRRGRCVGCRLCV